jgi:2-hydroxychromene-2-carboxylate isomerase
MHLVQILLPIDAGDRTARHRKYDELQRELTQRFGGVTAYINAPAEGLWDEGQQVEKDEVVVIEVMTGTLDRAWWASLRSSLETRLQQKEIVIRATGIELL